MKVQYHPELLEKFPHTVGGVIHAINVQNTPTPETLQAEYVFEQQDVIGRMSDAGLSEIPALAAWRSVFRQFGTEPTKYRSAAEALTRRLMKKGDIPFLNTLVDIGNLISIRYALPVAVFDLRTVVSPVSIRFATGHEKFTELGRDEVDHPDPGEVIFVDQTDTVMSRRWCWRQGAQTTIQLDTNNVLITVEAQHHDGRKDVANALADLLALLIDHVRGDYAHAILDAETPTFED